MPKEKYFLKSPKGSLNVENNQDKPRSKQLQCNICRRAFISVERRNSHVQRHFEMQFKCPTPSCGNMFIEFVILQKHVRNKHKFKVYHADKERCRVKNGSHQSDVEKTGAVNEQQKSLQIFPTPIETMADVSKSKNTNRKHCGNCTNSDPRNVMPKRVTIYLLSLQSQLLERIEMRQYRIVWYMNVR